MFGPRMRFASAVGSAGTVPNEALVVAGDAKDTDDDTDEVRYASGDTKVTAFATEFLDIGSNFASSTFTAPEGMLVHVVFMAHLTYIGTSTQAYAYADINSGERKARLGDFIEKAATPSTYGLEGYGASAKRYRRVFSAPVFLEANDTLDIRIQTDGNVDLNNHLLFILPVGASAAALAVDGATTGLPMLLLDLTNPGATLDLTADGWTQMEVDPEFGPIISTAGLTPTATGDKVVVNTAGTYRAFACAGINKQTGQDCELEIRVNGSEQLEEVKNSGDGYYFAHVEGELTLSANDEVTVYAYASVATQNIERGRAYLLLVKEP